LTPICFGANAIEVGHSEEAFTAQVCGECHAASKLKVSQHIYLDCLDGTHGPRMFPEPELPFRPGNKEEQYSRRTFFEQRAHPDVATIWT